MDTQVIIALAVGFIIGWILYDVAKYCWRRATGKINRKGEKL